MVSGVRSVQKASAVDLVLHEIRRSILNGDLPPGRPFTVPALTERLGVSHVPVREALRQLEAQGLVVLSPSRSATVTALEPGDLRAIYRLRITVEPDLAARSAADRTPAGLDELEALLHETFADGPGEAFWDAHRRFHEALIRPAASEWDLRLLAPLWDASERYTRLVFDPLEAPETFAAPREAAHADLLAAARSRDPERVREETARHLRENRETMLARMARVGEAWADATTDTA